MSVIINWLVDSKEWLFSGAGIVIISLVVRFFIKRNNSSTTQTIKSGTQSTNIQAGRDINMGSISKGNDAEE